LRTKSLKLDGWLKLVDDTRLIDGQFTLQDATQCYLWSRMAVIDELKVPELRSDAPPGLFESGVRKSSRLFVCDPSRCTSLGARVVD
jgi:hypothetical protein